MNINPIYSDAAYEFALERCQALGPGDKLQALKDVAGLRPEMEIDLSKADDFLELSQDAIAAFLTDLFDATEATQTFDQLVSNLQGLAIDKLRFLSFVSHSVLREIISFLHGLQRGLANCSFIETGWFEHHLSLDGLRPKLEGVIKKMAGLMDQQGLEQARAYIAESEALGMIDQATKDLFKPLLID